MNVDLGSGSPRLMLLMGFASDDGGFFLLVGAGGRMLREPSI
jgi:hypothetical protein